LKNIQVIDGAENATCSIFQATDEEFALIFPGDGQDIEFIEDFIARPVKKKPARLSRRSGFDPFVGRMQWVHGTLFYQWGHRKKYFPRSKREIDTPEQAINQAQRELFRSLSDEPMPWKP
jgi:hypothetical protein